MGSGAKNSPVELETIISDEELRAVLLPAAQASTLPAQCYTSPEIYQLEVKRVFCREWLCLGRVEEVENPGDYFTIDIADEPLLVVRDTKYDIRVLSRVCRHRGTDLVQGRGNEASFRCPYHAWTYGLDGRLIGAPEMNKTDGFDLNECRLPSFQVEVWEGFIFANLDADARPLTPQLAALSKKLANYGIGDLRLVFNQKFDGNWNWKVFVDNFNECYHHLGTHKDTLQDVSPAHLTIIEDTDGPYCFQRCPMAQDESNYTILPALENLTAEQRRETLVVTLFPTLLLIPLSGFIIYIRVLPRETSRVTLQLSIAVPQTTMNLPDFQERLKELIDSTLEFHNEDMRICDAVERGLSSSWTQQGRLSWLDKPLWQFNQWLIERLRTPVAVSTP